MKTITLTEKDLQDAKTKLAELKQIKSDAAEQELAIRNFIANALHPGEDGAKTVTIGETKLTVKRGLYHRITRADADKLVQDHPDVSLEVLSFKPEVRVKGFKEHLDTVSEYITVSAGPPTVEFKD